MNKLVGVILLVAGVCFLVYGFNAADSMSSDISRFFNGTPNNRSIMLLILGGVLTILGLSSLGKKELS